MDSSGRLEELKLLWETDPTAKVYLQLSDEYRRLGRVAEAIQVLEKTLAQRPRDPRGRVALARCKMDIGEMGEAVKLLEEVTKLDPAHGLASKLLLECHLQARDADKAAERFNIYRLLHDRDPELDHLEFRLRRLQEHPEEVEAAPAPVLAEAPTAAAAQPFPVSAEAPPVHAARPEDIDQRVAALEASFGVHHAAHGPAPSELAFAPFAAPPLAAEPLPSSVFVEEPIFADKPASAVGRAEMSHDDPFGNLLQPIEKAPPAADLFSLLAPVTTPSPSFDDLWGGPAIAAPAPLVSPVPAAVADPFAELLAPPATSPPPDPFGGLLSPAASLSVDAPPVPAFQSNPAPTFEFAPAPAFEPAPVFEPTPAPVFEPAAVPVFEAAPVFEPAPEPSVEAAPVVSDTNEETATLGEVYLQQGYLEEAEVIFQRVLAREPQNRTALAGLTRLAELRAPTADPVVTAASDFETPGEEEPRGETYAAPAAPWAPLSESPAFAELAYPAPVHPTSEPVYEAPAVAVSQEAVPAPLVSPSALVAPRLDAAFLLAQRTYGDILPEGLTAKKILILRRYLDHLRPTRASHVQ